MTELALDVRELSFEEIEGVAGGPLPVLAVLVIKAAVYTGVGTAGAAAGVGLVLAVKEAVT